MSEFEAFGKIPRLFRPVVITEKIDGTNAQVFIRERCGDDAAHAMSITWVKGACNTYYEIFAGSRNRWITPGADNYGFAAWVRDHAQDLLDLGPGRHFGEWWGQGIGRGYGLAEKRFSLFNVGRWYDAHGTNAPDDITKQRSAPDCCRVVPILWRSDRFMTQMVDAVLLTLRADGSMAAPGFMRPEGVVVFHAASGQIFKAACENDAQPKGAKE